MYFDSRYGILSKITHMHTYLFIKLNFFLLLLLNLEFLNLERYLSCPGYQETRLCFLLFFVWHIFFWKVCMYAFICISNQFGGYSSIRCEVWVQFYFFFKLLPSCLIAIYLKWHRYHRDLKCHFNYILNFLRKLLLFWTFFLSHCLSNHIAWLDFKRCSPCSMF